MEILGGTLFKTTSPEWAAPTLRGVNDMYGQLTLLVITAALITGTTVIAIAGIVVAVVVVIGGVLVIRSGKNKGTKTPGSAGQTDWQRQSQVNGAGGWNPQAMNNNPMGGMNNDAPAWGQQGQMGGQSGWNNQPMTQQAQQNAWGGGQDVQSQNPAWAAQSNQSQPAWAAQNNPAQNQQPGWVQNAQQPSSPAWAAQNNPIQQPDANSWNNSGLQAAPGTQPAAAQDGWGMQSPGMAQGQGMQQPPTAFGNASAPAWNQPGFAGTQGASSGPNDGWSGGAGTPQPQYAPQTQGANNAMGGFSSAPMNNPAQAAQAPAWQQSNYAQNSGNAAGWQGMQGQPAENTMMGAVDNDRTIIRAPGAGLGVVRVEEGKEPGREYEVRKESLSIGRSRESDIFLEDLAVSRLHASIVNQGNGNYALKDEGSANGTKINGQLVGKYQTYPLQDGDRIQLGQTVLVFGHR